MRIKATTSPCSLAVRSGAPPALTWPPRLALVLLAVSLACIAVSVVRYPALLSQPRAGRYLIEPVAALAAYGALCLWVPRVTEPPVAARRCASDRPSG